MIGDQIRYYRKTQKISQKDLATQLFISQQAVGKWERNEATPNPEAIVKMSQIFGISTDELLGCSKEGEKSASTDEDGQERNTIKILGRDGSRYEATVSDSQRELLKQMLDNLKPVDDENL